MTCFGPWAVSRAVHRAVDIQAVDAERATLVWGILNTIRGWFGWETSEGTRPNEDEREGMAIDELHRDDFSHIGRAVPMYSSVSMPVKARRGTAAGFYFWRAPGSDP